MSVWSLQMFLTSYPYRFLICSTSSLHCRLSWNSSLTLSSMADLSSIMPIMAWRRPFSSSDLKRSSEMMVSMSVLERRMALDSLHNYTENCPFPS
jgi:hypothetical protein